MNIRTFEQAVILAELAATNVELTAREARWLLDEIKHLQETIHAVLDGQIGKVQVVTTYEIREGSRND